MTAVGTSRHLGLVARAEELGSRCAGLDADSVVAACLAEFSGKVAILSSFGAEAAALIHIVSRVDPSVPVIFLNTLRHFPETLVYKERLTRALGLKNVIDAEPDAARLEADDPDLTLATRNPDMCCYIRKTLPMVRALRGFDAYFTGRKRFQSPGRAALPLCEVQDRWIKVNPLIAMTRDDIDLYFRRHNLPRHPLEANGYLSIGCLPCTQPVSDLADIRSGRWRGTEKTECGIHFGEDGKIVRNG